MDIDTIYTYPGDLPDPGIELVCLTLVGVFLTAEPPGKDPQNLQWAAPRSPHDPLPHEAAPASPAPATRAHIDGEHPLGCPV